ncbi:MAG TPA: flagellin [Gammaproteobacteria bacterium]|nr:flagellin [Gammaproteobacteria bacterium]
MAQVINTNVMSLNAQRNLNSTSAAMSTALQRLSSGLRINSARDDAAGLAIATRMTTQIGGLSTAIRNANDGISIAQTAEGAMVEMTRSLNRMHDLSVQAASYNTSTDRASINNEVQQLNAELSRIVSQTRYNGEQLLTGGFSASIQVGAEVNETISINVSNLSTTGMGVATNYSATAALDDATLATRLQLQFAGALATSTVNGIAVSDVAANSNSINKIDAVNAGTSSHGVTAFSYGNSAVATAASAAPVAALGKGDFVVNGIQIDGSANIGDLVTNINNKVGEHGVTAVNAGGTLVMFNRDGEAIEVTANTADAATLSGFAQGSTAVDAGANGLIVLNQNLGSNTVNYNAATTGQALSGVSGASTALTDASVASMTVNTSADASLAMLAFKQSIEQINSDRSILGAKMNRFDSLVRNLDNVRENLSAARSRIQDADFAAETAALTRAQILQQAGTAMVSQANSMPQSVLSLLQ